MIYLDIKISAICQLLLVVVMKLQNFGTTKIYKKKQKMDAKASILHWLRKCLKKFCHPVVKFLTKFGLKHFWESLLKINEQIKNPSLNIKDLNFEIKSKTVENNIFHSNFEIGV